MLIGRDRTIWIDESAPTAAVHLWKVLDLKGNVVATLQIPRNVRVVAAELGRFWGTETDADGLQSVVRYRLR